MLRMRPSLLLAAVAAAALLTLTAAAAAAAVSTTAAATPVARKLLQSSNAAAVSEVIAAEAQFHAVEVQLLRNITQGVQGAQSTYQSLMGYVIACDGDQPSKFPTDAAAMELQAVTFQYPEFQPFENMRNDLIEGALAQVKQSPYTSAQCAEGLQRALDLGVPEAAMALY